MGESYSVGVLVVTLSALSLAGLAAAQTVDDSPPPIILNPDVTITATTIPLNPYQRKLDGQWLCSQVASDGKVYFGSSTHSPDTGAMFSQYDPATGQVNVLAQDIETICGEDPNLYRPQGKLHSALLEYDGWLYTGTYWGYDGKSYPGQHVLRYQLGSLEAGSAAIEDLGISRAGATSYFPIAVDSVYDKIYTNADGYIYSLNLDGTGKTYRGYVGGICQNHFTDSLGNLWTTTNPGNLFEVPAVSGAIQTHSNALPALVRPDGGTTGGRWWRWGAKVDDDHFLFQMQFDSYLYEFDAAVARTGDIAGAFRQVANVGLGGLDMCLGGETVYWLQSPRPYGDTYVDPLTGTTKTFTNEAKGSDLHLMSLGLDDPNSEIIDWGRLIDTDGRTPYRCEGMSADAYGNVYLTGDWRVLPTDPDNYSTLRHNGDGIPGTYTDLWRGQFFAVTAARDPIWGDTNNDGRINTNDADILWALFGTTVPPAQACCDLTGDNQVTFADAQELVQVVVGTSLADTDLDGTVGLTDLGHLAGRYNQAGLFSDGDTNGDGLIDLLDLGKLASDYGKTFAPSVPEPASAFVLLVGLPLVWRRRTA